MEISRPLAVESFSESWLSDAVRLSAFSGFDEEPCGGSPKCSYATTTNSRKRLTNRFNEEAQNFDFGINPAASEGHTRLVHADELFSDGLIRPIFVNPLGTHVSNYTRASNISSSLHVSSFSSKAVTPDVQISCCTWYLGRWRKVCKRILKKLFGYPVVVPFCHKMGGRKSVEADDIGLRRVEVIRSMNNSPQPSPQRSRVRVYSAVDWYDIESSINDAVLHCKKSIGMCVCCITL